MDEYQDFDVKAAAADIGKDLFTPSSAPTNEVVERDNLATGEVVKDVKERLAEVLPEDTKALVKPENTDPNSPEPRVEPGVNSEQPLALPKSWKKDTESLWAKADPALKKYVYEREANVMRGIQQYQGGYNNWDKLITPFIPLLQSNPQVNPIDLLQGLMNTHLQLLNPQVPAQQKATIVNNLLREYGIDLSNQTAEPAEQRLLAELNLLRQELGTVKQTQLSTQQRIQQEDLRQHQSTVEAFAADPKNKYFDEVGNDILRFVQTGTAADLQSAYDLACWANPAVRVKMIAEQRSSLPNNPQKPRDANGKFVNLDDTPVTHKVKKSGSIDSTIDAIVASHFTKH